MDMLRRIFQRRSGQIDFPGVIDHVPVPADSRDWREERLKQAQERYGRPFKCAGDQLPHEILVKTRAPAEISGDQAFELAGMDELRRFGARARRRTPFRFGRR